MTLNDPAMIPEKLARDDGVEPDERELDSDDARPDAFAEFFGEVARGGYQLVLFSEKAGA